ncbi:Rv1733c family protein [Kitasatospora purpeofusca]|uniref:Rv1733c family protein n=1 Tax=Kitasatospora purpeofusca TaxID=67352 RepID=UPI003F4ABECD
MSRTPRPARTAPPPRRARRALRLALGRRRTVRAREPLARPVDRARSRAWLAAGLALVLGLAGVAGAAVLGHRAAGRTAEADRGRLHRTEALVLGRLRAEDTGAGRWSGGYEKRVDTSVSWTSPDGLARTGTVEVPRSAATGSTVTLWVDDDGRPATPPATAVGLAVGVVCTGLAGAAVLAALIGCLLTLRLRALDRRAARDWERSWAHWEPRWSGRASQPQDD